MNRMKATYNILSIRIQKFDNLTDFISVFGGISECYVTLFAKSIFFRNGSLIYKWKRIFVQVNQCRKSGMNQAIMQILYFAAIIIQHIP